MKIVFRTDSEKIEHTLPLKIPTFNHHCLQTFHPKGCEEMMCLIKIINTGFLVFLISEHEQVAIITLYTSYNFPLNISIHFAPKQKNSHPIKAAKQSIVIFKNGRRAQLPNSDIKVRREKKDSVSVEDELPYWILRALE